MPCLSIYLTNHNTALPVVANRSARWDDFGEILEVACILDVATLCKQRLRHVVLTVSDQPQHATYQNPEVFWEVTDINPQIIENCFKAGQEIYKDVVSLLQTNLFPS